MDMVSRATAIIGSPRQEWPVIAAEPTDIAELYSGYIVYLAGILFCGELIEYVVLLGFRLGAGIKFAVSGYIMTLVGVAVLAFLSSKLAPRFGGVEDVKQGFKLVAYSHTPGWLGGAFLIIPWIGWLPLVACSLYGLYIFWLGIPVLLRIPDNRRVAFVVSLIVAEVIIALAIQFLLRLVFGPSLMLMIR
jgi:hypothetical protein